MQPQEWDSWRRPCPTLGLPCCSTAITNALCNEVMAFLGQGFDWRRHHEQPLILQNLCTCVCTHMRNRIHEEKQQQEIKKVCVTI